MAELIGEKVERTAMHAQILILPILLYVRALQPNALFFCVGLQQKRRVKMVQDLAPPPLTTVV